MSLKKVKNTVPLKYVYNVYKADKLDVDKLVPIDLCKLIDVVKNDIVKKMYILLISKILQTIYLPLLT